MKFEACVHRVSFDKEGEGTVVLKTPLSELTKVVTLLGQLERSIIIEVKEHE
jgi:hypothetical protein